MADRQLATLRDQLKSPSLPYEQATSLLSKAKILLLQTQSLTPSAQPSSSSSSSSSSSPHLQVLAREILELGALHAIRSRNAPAFIRYVDQLQPFYALGPGHPAAVSGPAVAERNKITGLYLLLLLSQSRYSEFHSELEALATREGGGSAVDVEGDRYLGYPIRLERWLMEGSYDRVWKAMKKGEVPCEEYGVFSEILTTQIRSEIASSSERAYPSLPLSSTKSLLFLDSEGAVVEFAHQRGWTVRDGQIFFPAAGAEAGDEPEKDVSLVVIENVLGYARQLETIV